MGVLVLRLQLGCARVIAVALAITAGCIALPGAALADTSYSVGTPIVDTIANGPWTTSQPDTAFGQTQYPLSDLLPTYTPQAPNNNTPLTNVAVYPASSSTSTPYPSGVAGTPGPLDGYCASGGPEPESGGPVPEPSGVNEPFAPYYFPDVVRNSDGSLTGYFDYRPKDADEEITVATSTDNGQTWTTEGQALEQNPSYCPVADTNDDGEGHPYVTSVGGTSRLYTLERAAGDNAGVGLLVHHVDPTAADPLSGVPATERSGVDPDTFASSGVSVPTGGGTTIPVSTLGTSGTINSIVAGPYEDADAADPSASVITCTGTSSSPSPELTGCTVAGASALSVSSGDELLQVIATAGNPKNPAPFTVPASSAQNPSGTGGLANLGLTNANATVSPFLLYTLNLNAPNRIYVDGHAVYCTQANADPTTKLEDCTSPDGPITVNSGDPITADPITPATAQMTTGLIAPDGIVGTLPSYPGAPGGSTVVVYTEKKLGYYLEGQVNGYVSGSPAAFSATAPTLGTSTGATINYSSFPSESEPLPSTGSFTVYFGTSTSSPIQAVTCTGWTTSVPAGAPAGSTDLTGCTGGTGTVAIGNWVGAPNAAIAPYSALGQVGEGTDSSSKGPEKLFGNNEDLTVLRVAYTTNGVDFTDLGAISGSSSGSGATNGGYNDVSNPNQQYSPDSSADPTTATINPSSPANLSSGSSDQIELRYIGSRGTIVTNPDGTLGMRQRRLQPDLLHVLQRRRTDLVGPHGRAEHRLHVLRLLSAGKRARARERSTARRERLRLRPCLRASGRAEHERQPHHGVLGLPPAKADRGGGNAGGNEQLTAVRRRGHRPRAVPQHPHRASLLHDESEGRDDERPDELAVTGLRRDAGAIRRHGRRELSRDRNPDRNRRLLRRRQPDQRLPERHAVRHHDRHGRLPGDAPGRLGLHHRRLLR
jgi:hypothetical protein